MRCSSISAVVIACGLGLVSSPSRTFGQVAVSGYTYELAGVNYKGLPNVEIQVFRRGNPIFGRPKSSGSDGAFNLVVPGPEPFDVVFFGPARLPEIYALAGKNGTTNQLHVTVIAMAEAKRLEMNPKKQIDYILRRVSGDRELAGRLQAMLKEF